MGYFYIDVIFIEIKNKLKYNFMWLFMLKSVIEECIVKCWSGRYKVIL